MTGQVGYYTTSSVLDYVYVKNYYEMIAIDLSKQQELDIDLKANHQINSTGNLDRAGNMTMFLIIEEAKETLDFSQVTENIVNLFCFNII